MWVIIETKPSQEKRAKLNLENQGFKVYLPYLSHKKYIKGIWQSHKEVMFKNYLFISKDTLSTNLHKIKYTLGIKRLLIDKSTLLPFELSSSEMTRIVNIVQNNNNMTIESGDHVVYTKGSNSKIEGKLIKKLNNNRALLLLNLLGKQQQVSVELKNLQKVI